MGKYLDASFINTLGSRTYKVHIPKSYHGQSLPLIVMLHGCTQDPDDFAVGSRMNLLSENSGCFALYPCQTQAANLSKCWNWFNPADQCRDSGEPAIVAGMTREVMHAYNIDAARVFIAGMSAGAAMAVVMAVTYPELYAAVGAHSGMPYRCANSVFSALNAMRHGADHVQPLGVAGIPLIAFHGEQDRTVNPRNSEQLMFQWLESRPDIGSDGRIEEAGTSNGRAYLRTQHSDSRGVFAEHWLIKQSAHAWSGGSASGSFADPEGPDASREMLRFFRGVRRRSRLFSRLIDAIKLP